MPNTTIKATPPRPTTLPLGWRSDGLAKMDCVDYVWFAWHPKYKNSYWFDDITNKWREIIQ